MDISFWQGFGAGALSTVAVVAAGIGAGFYLLHCVESFITNEDR